MLYCDQEVVMREIKFRAWYEPTKEWLEDTDFNVRPNGVPFDIDAEGDTTYLSYTTLLQYTGLKDKNGVEIYEGDIVAKVADDWPSCSGCHDSVEQHLKSLEKNYEVVYRIDSFLGRRNLGGYDPFQTDNDGNTYSTIDGGTHGYIEVIGNIYENKDLLA